METHFALSDDDFEKAFEASILDPKIFSHEGHIRLVWIHIKKYGALRAIENKIMS